MSFPIVQSATDTVTKTFATADDIIDGTRYAGRMYKNTMQQSYRIQLAESLVETNALATSYPTLSDEQRKLILDSNL